MTDNPNAFPFSAEYGHPAACGGMTLRDYFAGQVVSLCWQQACVMVNAGRVNDEHGATVAAGMAYLVADAMLLARQSGENRRDA